MIMMDSPSYFLVPSPLPRLGATPTIPKPAVVSGDKAVEVALSEGLCPVINKELDVFAVCGSSGDVVNGSIS